VPHGFHRDPRPAPDVALPEPGAEADDPDEEPYFRSADGDRSELQQTAAAQAGYFTDLLSTNEEINENIRPLLKVSREHINASAAIGLCADHLSGTGSAAFGEAEVVEDDPRVGPITARTWALEIGDVSRFQSVKQAIRYCGLCSAERSSADKLVRMPISKQRNKHIQQTLVEAVKLAPRYNHELALVYERERQRGNKNRATLAVARKMVAYMLAVERRKQDFVLTGKRSGSAAA
jgi:transposase